MSSLLASGQYFLTVDASPAVFIPDATTYRFYVTSTMPTTKSLRSSATLTSHWSNVPEEAFNTALNSSWNASGINNSFVAIFPELADDSFATLGTAGPASTSGIEGAADPQVAEDPDQPITPFFRQTEQPAVNNSVVGASWF